jgi:hypothetical protein
MQPERDTMKLDTAKFLVRRKIFPVRAKNSLFGAQQGKWVQHTGVAARIGVENRQNSRKILKVRLNSLLISLFSGNLRSSPPAVAALAVTGF